jgi:hypothetical protein
MRYLVILVVCGVLVGCAAPEPEAPIQRYRAAYGFPIR